MKADTERVSENMRDLVLACSGKWTLSIIRQTTGYDSDLSATSVGVGGCHLNLAPSALYALQISALGNSMEAPGSR